MDGVKRALFLCRRRLHTFSSDGPSESLRSRLVEMKQRRRKRKSKDDDLFVQVPESREWLEKATMPMYLGVIATALFAKLLMMYDDSKSQERIERKIKKAPPGQGTVRMLSREEWEEIREVRPRTPFESKLARPNAKIRTGGPIQTGDLKDWMIDVLTDALTRVEDTVKQKP